VRVENMSTHEEWDRVVLHLSRTEASELRDALVALLGSGPGRHEHIPDAAFSKEITIQLVD
jgi:hypothetical protein